MKKLNITLTLLLCIGTCHNANAQFLKISAPPKYKPDREIKDFLEFGMNSNAPSPLNDRYMGMGHKYLNLWEWTRADLSKDDRSVFRRVLVDTVNTFTTKNVTLNKHLYDFKGT